MLRQATLERKPSKSLNILPKTWTKKWSEHSKVQLSEEDVDYIVQNTAISREQIEQQFEVFITNHPNGRISKKSFRSMMKACYPGADVEKLTKHIWRMYDANNDGAIDFRELMLVLYIMSDGTAEQNLKQIFKIFDLNNDGKINHEEMEKITKDLSKLFKEDRETLAEGIFKEMDTNNDGEISEEEFIQACLSQKKMSKKLTLKIIDIFLQ